jgi:hypothetical protein
MRDPVVPLDFGHWWVRVWGVFRRNLQRLGVLGLAPMALAGLYLIVISAVTPGQAGLQQKLREAAASSPTGQVSPREAFWLAFAPTLTVVVIFGVLSAVLGAAYQAVGYYLALREANGQPATLGQAWRVVRPRVLPLTGWALLAGIGISLVMVVPVLPGIFSGVRAIVGIGVLVAIALVAWSGVIVFSSLVGVVVVERAGIGRCFTLVRGRFWPTFGRMACTFGIALVYDLGLLLVTWMLALPFGGIQTLAGTGTVIVRTVELLLSIPQLVFLLAVGLVTYAELRFHQDSSTSARSLSAQLGR